MSKTPQQHYLYYQKSLDHELMLVGDDHLDKDTHFVAFQTFDEVDVSTFQHNASTVILSKTIPIPRYCS